MGPSKPRVTGLQLAEEPTPEGQRNKILAYFELALVETEGGYITAWPPRVEHKEYMRGVKFVDATLQASVADATPKAYHALGGESCLAVKRWGDPQHRADQVRSV